MDDLQIKLFARKCFLQKPLFLLPAYRIFGPPATFFIDREGVIRDVVLSPVTRERAANR
jgi:hypothetical protein